MTVYVFPGQGSQIKGMGNGLFDEFSSLTKQANDILQYDIKQLCHDSDMAKLSKTQYTQPAMFVVNALTYLKRNKDGQPIPKYAIGHSLGEYSALFAAEVFDFATGVKLVQKRGELMGAITGYKMAAVLGLTATEISRILQENNLSEIDLANFNTPKQTVISGKVNDIAKAKTVFGNVAGSMFFELPVSGAFHSRYMKPVQETFSEYLKDFTWSDPKITVIANVDVQPYTQANVADKLTKQLASPVQWVDTIKFLQKQGEKDFIEVGPGNKMMGLVRQCLNA